MRTAPCGTGAPAHLRALSTDSPSSSLPEETEAFCGGDRQKKGGPLLTSTRAGSLRLAGKQHADEVWKWRRPVRADGCRDYLVKRIPSVRPMCSGVTIKSYNMFEYFIAIKIIKKAITADNNYKPDSKHEYLKKPTKKPNHNIIRVFIFLSHSFLITPLMSLLGSRSYTTASRHALWVGQKPRGRHVLLTHRGGPGCETRLVCRGTPGRTARIDGMYCTRHCLRSALWAAANTQRYVTPAGRAGGGT